MGITVRMIARNTLLTKQPIALGLFTAFFVTSTTAFRAIPFKMKQRESIERKRAQTLFKNEQTARPVMTRDAFSRVGRIRIGWILHIFRFHSAILTHCAIKVKCPGVSIEVGVFDQWVFPQPLEVVVCATGSYAIPRRSPKAGPR